MSLDLGLHVSFLSGLFLLTFAVYCIVPAFFIAAFLDPLFLAETVAGCLHSDQAALGVPAVPNVLAANHIEKSALLTEPNSNK